MASRPNSSIFPPSKWRQSFQGNRKRSAWNDRKWIFFFNQDFFSREIAFKSKNFGSKDCWTRSRYRKRTNAILQQTKELVFAITCQHLAKFAKIFWKNSAKYYVSIISRYIFAATFCPKALIFLTYSVVHHSKPNWKYFYNGQWIHSLMSTRIHIHTLEYRDCNVSVWPQNSTTSI